MRIRKRKKTKTLPAVLTVEAAVIMCVSVLILGNVMQFSLKMYQNLCTCSSKEWKPGKITPAKVLTIKHLGGKEYNEYKLQHNIQTETE